jgi:CP family cyanate transporter-like MFS transporter
MSPRAIWLGVALVVAALNLRLSITSVPPIVEDVRTGLGLSSAAVGAVTTLPVLCFGLAAFGAPALGRRWGDELVILVCLVLVALGSALRMITEVGPFFGGTLVLGAGIAIVNVLVSSVIKRTYARPGRITGVYITVLLVGGGLAAAVSVPLVDALGSWDRALAIWALPALLAALMWLPVVRGGRPEGAPAGPAARLRGDRSAWLLSGYLSCQTFLAFAMVAWAPEILREAGLGLREAGGMAAVFMLLGIPPALVFPVVATRPGAVWALVTVTVVAWCAGLSGLLAAPAAMALLWMALTGFAQGAGFALALALIVIRARDGAHAAALSGMVQGIGYSAGAASPPVIGLLHDATGQWAAPLACLLSVGGLQLVLGLLLTRGHAREAGAREPVPEVASVSQASAW